MGSPTSRKFYGRSIQRTFDRLDAPDFRSLSVADLRELLRLVERYFNLFTENHAAIVEPIVEAQILQSQDAIYADIETIYIRTRGRINERITELLGQQPAVAAEIPAPAVPEPIRFDPATVGTFAGVPNQWRQFRARFIEHVHSNARIEPTLKFRYLCQALTGRAATIVGAYTGNFGAYASAWQRLCDYYEDEYAQIQTVIEELLNLPKIAQQSPQALRTLSTNLRAIFADLRSLRAPIDAAAGIYICAIVRCLDATTRSEWEARRNHSSPTLSVLQEFLASRARDLDTNAATTSRQPQTSANAGLTTPDSAIVNVRLGRNSTAQPSQPTAAPVAGPSNASTAKNTAKPPAVDMPCRNCNGSHALFRCPELLQLDIPAREARIRHLQLCLSCFRRGHNDKQCKFAVCARCPGSVRHNTVLCPNVQKISRRNADRSADRGAKQTPQSKRRRTNPANLRPAGWSDDENNDWPMDGNRPAHREPTPPPCSFRAPLAAIAYTPAPNRDEPPQFAQQNADLESWADEMRQDPNAAQYMPAAIATGSIATPISSAETDQVQHLSQSGAAAPQEASEQPESCPPNAGAVMEDAPAKIATEPTEQLPPSPAAAPLSVQTDIGVGDAQTNPQETLDQRIQRMLLNSPAEGAPGVRLEPNDDEIIADDPNSQVMGDDELADEILAADQTDQNTGVPTASDQQSQQ